MFYCLFNSPKKNLNVLLWKSCMTIKCKICLILRKSFNFFKVSSFFQFFISKMSELKTLWGKHIPLHPLNIFCWCIYTRDLNVKLVWVSQPDSWSKYCISKISFRWCGSHISLDIFEKSLGYPGNVLGFSLEKLVGTLKV